jgi:autotransporter-associated beta strand protein
MGPAADSNGSGGSINNGTTLTSYLGSYNPTLIVDGTLRIASGMVSSAFFAAGNSSTTDTLIQGGTLDFGSREAIINNQNGFIRFTDGAVVGGNLQIRSNIAGTGGLLKTGFSQVILDGMNTYSGLTTVSDGNLFLRNGRMSGGAGGPGNGYKIEGNGQLLTNSGIILGTAAAPEDILVGTLQGGQVILQAQNDLTSYFGDITVDNVDAAGQTLFTPLISASGGNATLIINGDIYGGDTPISNDVLAIDSRILSTAGSANSQIILRGQIGDRGVGGVATPVGSVISTLPTLAGVRTNENEVFRFTVEGNEQLNVTMEKQYAAAGRLTLNQGVLNISYTPAPASPDGGGFWTTTAISRIAGADSTSSFAVNGNTTFHGFTIAGGSNTFLFLGQPGKDGISGQNFNMASWNVAAGNNTWIGGVNETGSVTFGTGAGSLVLAKAVRLYGMSGGTVNMNVRLGGNVLTQKIGRGTVTLQNTNAGTTASDTGSFELGGGTMIIDHSGQNAARFGNAGNFTFRGGSLISKGRTDALFAASYSNEAGAVRTVGFTSGGSEIAAETTAAQNLTITIGNTNATNGVLTRAVGATASLVENQSAGGVSSLLLQFGQSTALARSQVIPWATYSSQRRRALDFAVLNTTYGVESYSRAPAEFQNSVALWAPGANQNVSENGGIGFFGTLANPSGGLAFNTLRFDTTADSLVNLGGQILSLMGGNLAGAMLVSSNTGASNKTITNGSIGIFDSSARPDYNITVVGTTTSGSRNLTSVTPVAGLSIGMTVTGTGIPAGSAIAAISGSTVTLTNNATASGTGVNLVANQLVGLTDGDNVAAPANLTISSMPLTTGLLPGMNVRGMQSVTAVKVTTPGSAYTSAPTVAITGGGGTGATGTALLGVNQASFTINGGTTVYSTAPSVTITDGGGTGATATAVLTAGVVSGITITSPGTGFTSAPSIAFTGGVVTTPGTDPTGTGNATNFVVSAVIVTAAGSAYATEPAIAFTGGGGAGAVAKVIVPFVVIPAGTYITAVTPTSITLSLKPTLSSDVGVKMPLIVGSPELIVHQYGQGNLNIDVPVTGTGSVTIAGPSTTNPSEFNTTGTVRFNASNTYTGRTYLNGSVLEIGSASALGAEPFAVDNTQLTMNGGTLRWTGGVSSLGNRGITLQGSGGVIEVTNPDGNLLIGTGMTGTQAQLVSEDVFRGDLVKTGPGTLTFQGAGTGHNSGFQGLLDVRQGTLAVMVDVGDANAGTLSVFGTNRSWEDGTIFRQGTNLQAFLGAANNAGVDWNIEEFMTFEGGNTFTYTGLLDINANNNSALDTQLNLGNRRPLNLNGITNIAGNTTFDIGFASNLRFALNAGYVTGSGDIIKDGQGQMEFRGNIPDWKGNLVIKQGTVYAISAADMLGSGYGSGKTITLGDAERQGTAQLLIQNPDGVQNWLFDVKHDINVVYNPTQTKRLGIDNIANGNRVSYDGNITLNDNLILLIQDGGISSGGEQAILNFNGKFRDGLTTGGNLVIQGTENGGANDNVNGRMTGYAVFNGDNSAWTGDVQLSVNLSYDQDKTTVLRLGNNLALTAANDVVMNYNSVLQAGGQTVSIGSLSTLGGNGSFNGDAGTMSASTNGSTEIIENAASSAGILTIAQTTPVSFEAAWDAKFRDGVINSQFFNVGTNTHLPSAALSVVKSGAGWSVMTLDNDYTGATTVAQGVLQIGRDGVGDTGANNALGVTVNSGATVAGTGWAQGGLTVQSGGIVSPGDAGGNALGTLNVNGAALFAVGSAALLQVRMPTYNNPGAVDAADNHYVAWRSGISSDAFSNALKDLVTTSQHDMINASDANGVGTISIALGTQITLANDGYTPKAGDVFHLFKAGTLLSSINTGAAIRTGTETGTDLNLFELGGILRWDTTLLNTLGVLLVVTAEGPVVGGFAPSISAPPARSPASGILAPGTTFTLTGKADSSSPKEITMQWLLNDVPLSPSLIVSETRTPANGIPVGIAGVTSTITLVASSETKGTYKFVASNTGGQAFSTGVLVDVNDMPLIPAGDFTVGGTGGQPTSRLVNPSLPGIPISTTFSSRVTGPGPYTARWYKVVGGVETLVFTETGIANVQNKFTSNFTIVEVTEADQGNYICRFTNPGGSVTSNTATLTVRDAVSNVVATRTRNPDPTYLGETIIFSVTAQGEADLRYQWFKNGTALVGKTASTLSVTNSAISTVPDTYFVKVTNPVNDPDLVSFTNAVQSNLVTLPVLDSKPVINSTVMPHRTMLAGESLSMSVTASGRPDLRYQWKRNAVNVVGATGSTFTVNPVTLASGGTYTCEISNITTTKLLAGPAEIVVVDSGTTVVPVKLGAPTITLTANVGRGTKTSVIYKWYKRVITPVVDSDPLITDTAVSTTDARFTGEESTGTVTSTLKIANAVIGDDGLYVCKVKGTDGVEVAGCLQDVRVYDAVPINQTAIALKDGIVGGYYTERIVVDPARNRSPVSYAVVGTLPPGLTLDKVTGIISGRPTTAKTYTFTTTATNMVGTSVEKITSTIVIKPLPLGLAGNYAGPISRNAGLNGNLGGRFEMTVTTMGAVSGKVTLGSSTARSFTGAALEIDAMTGAVQTNTIRIPAAATLPALTLVFNMNITPAALPAPPATVLTDATISDGTNTATFKGWRNNWGATVVSGVSAKADNFTGLYNFGISLPDGSALIGNAQVPQGYGYGSFTVASAGTFTLAGRTPDGETLTGAYWLGPNGEFFVYQTLYTTTLKGSILGEMQIELNAAGSVDDDISGDLTIVRPPNGAAVTVARTYRSGFGTSQVVAGVPQTMVTTPVSLVAFGARYLVPVTATTSNPNPLVFLNIAAASGTTRNAELIFSEDGSLPPRGAAFPAPYTQDVATLLPRNPNIPVTIAAKSAVTTPKINTVDNPASTTLVPLAATGAFSGKFTLSDSIARTAPQTPLVILRNVTYQGVVIRERTSAKGVEPRVVETYGVGHFLIDQLPPDAATPATSTPRLSGSVILEKAPTP